MVSIAIFKACSSLSSDVGRQEFSSYSLYSSWILRSSVSFSSQSCLRLSLLHLSFSCLEIQRFFIRILFWNSLAYFICFFPQSPTSPAAATATVRLTAILSAMIADKISPKMPAKADISIPIANPFLLAFASAILSSRIISPLSSPGRILNEPSFSSIWTSSFWISFSSFLISSIFVRSFWRSCSVSFCFLSAWTW